MLVKGATGHQVDVSTARCSETCEWIACSYVLNVKYPASLSPEENDGNFTDDNFNAFDYIKIVKSDPNCARGMFLRIELTIRLKVSSDARFKTFLLVTGDCEFVEHSSARLSKPPWFNGFVTGLATIATGVRAPSEPKFSKCDFPRFSGLVRPLMKLWHRWVITSHIYLWMQFRAHA